MLKLIISPLLTRGFCNEMAKIAYIFPGQGSQAVGMGKDLFENFATAREVFEAADDALGFSLSEMCFTGSEADLQLTANTQPAILTTSVAAFYAMESEGFPTPEFVAGHSLGEYSALVAAGVLGFADAVQTVRKRGTYYAGSRSGPCRSDGCYPWIRCRSGRSRVLRGRARASLQPGEH
jgi:malonyl CoA-acyl carrier protein transacylase